METQSRNVIVELMTEDSIDWFVNVVLVGMVLNEMKRPDFINIDNFYKLARMGMATNSVFVSKQGEDYTGAIGGVITPNLFNPLLTTLSEMVWYVLPEYRKTRSGLMLLNHFVKYGNEVADDTTMSLLIDSPVKTLETRGFHKTEQAFYKRNHRIFNEK